MYNTSFMKYFFLLVIFCVLFIGIYNSVSNVISFGFITALQALYVIMFCFQLLYDSNINLRALTINIPKTKYTPEDNILIPLYFVILPGIILQLISSVFITILTTTLHNKYGSVKLDRNNRWYLNTYKWMFILATFVLFYLTYSYCVDFDGGAKLSKVYTTFLLMVFLLSIILPILNIVNANKLVKIIFAITN